MKSKNPMLGIPRALVAGMKRSGYSDAAIAHHFGTSESDVARYRAKHHIAGVARETVVTRGKEIFDITPLDAHRADELFAGLRFVDSPAAARPQGHFRGLPSHASSPVGCAAQLCADNV